MKHSTPYPDPWAFLSSIRRLARPRIETIVGDAESRGRVIGVRFALSPDDEPEPWNSPPSRRHRDPPVTGPLPRRSKWCLGDQIYLRKMPCLPALRNRLLRLAAFQNPEFYRAQAMRLPTYEKPRIIACAEDLPAHIALPRGCFEEVLALLAGLKIKPLIRDERVAGRPLEVQFTGTLRPEQETAAAAMLAHDTGVLAATTAFGKTVVAAWLIAARGVNTLVLVHRQQLLEQWIERLSSFLNLPAKSIGRLGGGQKKLTGNIDVALIQSLVRKGVVDDRMADYGHLIVDECHHLSAHSFELVARRAKARFVLGLSATVARKDGHHPIIFMQCGPVRHRVDAKQQADARPFTHHVIVRPTGFRRIAEPDPDRRLEYQNLCAEIIRSEPRNAMIRDDVIAALREGRSPLVLTERTEHVAVLAELIRPHAPHLIVLQGGMGRKSLRDAIARLAAIPENETRVVIATGKFVGEGFDDSRLDTLLLTMPVSWRGTIAQYAGRLHRLHEGKREVRIHDYADLDVPMLARMFDKRCAGYEAVGYTILLPASALPGWPGRCRCPSIPNGNKTTPPASAASSATAWMSRWPTCSSPPPALTTMRTAPAAPPKPSFSSAWNPYRKPPACSGSTPNCQSPSMAGARWKPTFSPPHSNSPSRSTGRSTIGSVPPTAATAARTPCSRNTAFWSCDFSLRTLANISTPHSTPSSGRSRTCAGSNSYPGTGSPPCRFRAKLRKFPASDRHGQIHPNQINPAASSRAMRLDLRMRRSRNSANRLAKWLESPSTLLDREGRRAVSLRKYCWIGGGRRKRDDGFPNVSSWPDSERR